MPDKKETLPGGTAVYTAAHHRIGTDALLLAGFCEAKRLWSACDLGSGCGIVLLSLKDQGLCGPSVGVEIDPDGTALLQRAIAENDFADTEAVTADFTDYRPGRLFDLVVANPPYFSAGLLPPEAGRARARHEVDATLAALCETAALLLKDGGRFCLCFPPARLAELTACLLENRLEPKRLQLCRKVHNAPPWLLLMDARKAGGTGLGILPDYILPPGRALHY